MSSINKSKYIAELTKLLGFMSSWDREAEIAKYSAMLDEYEDMDKALEAIGTPTKVAIGLAREYVPSPPPVVEVAEPEEAAPEGEGAQEEAEPGDAADEPDAAAVSAEATDTAAENTAEPAWDAGAPEPEYEPEQKPRAKPAALTFWVIGSVVLGLPVAIVLIALGLPFLAAGAGAVAASVEAVITILPKLALFSDKLLTLGGGCALGALGLVVAWFGLWLSLSLGWLWIGRVIFGQGRRLCFEKGGDDNG